MGRRLNAMVTFAGLLLAVISAFASLSDSCSTPSIADNFSNPSLANSCSTRSLSDSFSVPSVSDICSVPSVSDSFSTPSPSDSFSTPSLSAQVVKVTRLRKQLSGYDEVSLTLNITADFQSKFTWNTKQVFVFLAAEFESEKKSLKQVSLWEHIIHTKDDAKFQTQFCSYPLIDQGRYLLGEEVHLVLRWHVISKIGGIIQGQKVLWYFHLPEVYTSCTNVDDLLACSSADSVIVDANSSAYEELVDAGVTEVNLKPIFSHAFDPLMMQTSYVPQFRQGDDEIKLLRIEKTTDQAILRYFIGGHPSKPGKNQDILKFGIDIVKRQSNFRYMAAYLKAVQVTVTLNSPNLTLLIVSDAKFPTPIPSAHTGVYQILPDFYPPSKLVSLPPFSLLSTINPNCSLLVTTYKKVISFNRIPLNIIPIYIDESIAVYEMEAFVDPSLYLLSQYRGQSYTIPLPFSIFELNLKVLVVTIIGGFFIACVGCTLHFKRAAHRRAVAMQLCNEENFVRMRG